MSITTCVKCGEPLAEKNTVCPICGAPNPRPKFVRPSPPQKVTSPPKRAALKEIECPDCGSDNWQRVELAHSMGTSRHASSILVTDGEGIAVGTAAGKGQTQFASNISPPIRRSEGGAPFLLIIGILVCFSALSVLIPGAHPSWTVTDYFLPCVVFFTFGPVPIFIAISLLKKASAYNRDVFPTLLDKWKRTLVCLKCGKLWIPVEVQPVDES